MSTGPKPWTFTDADLERLRSLTQGAAAKSRAAAEEARAAMRQWHAVRDALWGDGRVRELRLALRDVGPPPSDA